MFEKNKPTNRSRDFCYDCGTKISKENTYPRHDTLSGLHARCKGCYIRRQKIWNRKHNNVKRKPRYSILIKRNSRWARRIYFNSEQEKQSYITQRNTQAKFGRTNDTRSSKVGGTEDWGSGINLTCDDVKPDGTTCGGLLRYSPKGELVCENCFLVSDTMLLSTERLDKFDASGDPYRFYGVTYTSYANEYLEEDSKTIDVFFNRAYSKTRKQ